MAEADPNQPEELETIELPESDQTEPEPNEAVDDTTDLPGDEEPKGPGRWQRFWAAYKAHKKIAVPITIVFVLGLLLGLPLTRYPLLGTVLAKDVTLTLIDSQTSLPVSGADVTINGKTGQTNGEGSVTLRHIKLGKVTLTATKKYYKDLSEELLVGFRAPKETRRYSIEATGRQVPLHIINKISGANLAGVKVKALDTEVQTDSHGEATIVLPPNQQKVSGEITLNGYNTSKVAITVNDAVIKDNTFGLTPEGKIYFLSKRTGKINVMKADLDGQNSKVVVKGTGKEEDTNTVLLAARDWKYLALLARRDTEQAHLYLIDTSTDQISEIDGGDNATVSLVGWSGHNFIYQVSRDNVHFWQSNREALKSFNADTKQLLTIDQTRGEGSGDSDYAEESISSVNILDNQVVYTKVWYTAYGSDYRLAGKRMAVYQAHGDGTSRQLVKDFDATHGYLSTSLFKPNDLYVEVTATKTSYYEFENGNLQAAPKITEDSFSKVYPTYLVSPSGQQSFWYEARDGKNALFIGNANGDAATQIATLSEFKPYGWYSGDYILVSKNDSELYVTVSTKNSANTEPLKITDYHKPDRNFYGYGYGYGGL